MQEEIPVRIQDTETGKFIQKPSEEVLVKKHVWVKRSRIQEIEKRLKDGQSFSSFVREAIAYFLENKEN